MVKALCELEKMCPPSVFVIMMHLPIHLAFEARVLGPVFYRWMHVFERLMKEYKGFVMNKARLEGCIAERFLKEETMIFCEGYKGGGSILQNLEENVDDLAGTNANTFIMEIKDVGPVGAGSKYCLDSVEFEQVRKWVLKSQKNYDMWENTKYEKYVDICKARAGRKFKVRVEDEFLPWLRSQSGLLSKKEADIASRPVVDATSYKKCAVNGFLIITKDYQMNKRNQNNGVSSNNPTTFRLSAKDKNPIDATAEYYGVLRKIIQLKYRSGYEPIVFKCDWVKLSHGVKNDKDTKLTMVNLSSVVGSSLTTDEPFILAEHVSQVFYSKDPLNPEWYAVIEVLRKLYSDLDLEETVVDESYAQMTYPNFSAEDEVIFSDSMDVVDFGETRQRKRQRKS